MVNVLRDRGDKLSANQAVAAPIPRVITLAAGCVRHV